MANNYSSDPQQSSPNNAAASRQSELGGMRYDGAAGSAAYSQLSAPNAPAAQLRLVAGTMLSNARYKIEKLIAAGGMGAVYRATDMRFKRYCAVKEMLDQFRTESERAQAVEWFAREAALLLELNHACIPRVRDFFVENGRNYLVMDFIEGRTLSEVMEHDGTIPGVNGARGVTEARARSWGQQLCNVLSYLHRQAPPIIFRDLKPANIMVTEREEIKLIDFGIARTFQAQNQSTIIMTPGYAPPEQLYGRAEPRSDIYALGATLHKVLTRHDAANNQPGIFNFPTVRTLRPDISVAFDQVIMKALSPTIEQRWSGATEMERALIALPPITAVPPAGGQPATALAPQPASLTPSIPAHTPSTPGVSLSSSPSLPSRAPAKVGMGTTGPAGMHIQAAQGFLNAMPPHVDAAYEAVKTAYALEPNNALVHKLFGQIFVRRVPAQPHLALDAYNHSLELNPEDAQTHKFVGDLSLYFYQQPAQGIPAYIQSLRLDSSDAETHQRLGSCYEKTNQFESALREYQEAVRLAPKNSMLLQALGQLALRMNRFPLAEQAFVQVLFINPGDHQARFLLSQVYEHEQKLEEAFRECGYVVGPLRTNPAVQQMYQRLRKRLGR
jgi:serine/threonine protein kinase